jgi:hypothetical protein
MDNRYIHSTKSCPGYMKFYHFIALDIEAKTTAVWGGTLLSDRLDGDTYILLYELGGFYVEVYYSMSLNRMVRLKPFKITSDLSPYLDQISIGELADLF